MDLDKIIHEENTLQFDTFSHSDMKRLALAMIDAIDSENLYLSFEIEINRLVVFRYMPHGTTAFNKFWMKKKRNTVNATGKSTLRFWKEVEAIGIKRDVTIEPKSDLVLCGGEFPIKIKNGCIIGAIATSGLNDLDDHNFIVKCLETHFNSSS